MILTRRAMLATCAGAVSTLPLTNAQETSKSSLGLVIHSFGVRSEFEKGADGKARIADPVRYLEHCRGLGVSAIQVGIGTRDDVYADDLKARVEAASMAIEAIISLPRDQSDLARFEAEVRTARRVGATIARTVMLSGRRYENFDSIEAFRTFTDHASASLAMAVPVVVRHGVRLAVENHKDWRADEFIDVLKRIGSDHVGVCLDVGNSIALLEDPIEVVEALAPLAITTHFKDMAVEESPDGFLLAEVPLGTGLIDLPRVVRTLRAARPNIRFHIEMITRDPLKIPCLTERYWTTFPNLPGKHLARSLAMVRAHQPTAPLPRVAGLDRADRLRVEDRNIRLCVTHAHETLGL